MKKHGLGMCFAAMPLAAVLVTAVAQGDTRSLDVALGQEANPQGQQWYNCNGTPAIHKIYASAIVYAGNNPVCIGGVGSFPNSRNYTTGTTQTWTCDATWSSAPITGSSVFIYDDYTILAQGPVTTVWTNVSQATSAVLRLAGTPANCNSPTNSYFMRLNAGSWGL